MKKWVSTADAAERTGWDVKTIRARCLSGDIPHQRIGNGPIRIAEWWVASIEERA